MSVSPTVSGRAWKPVAALAATSLAAAALTLLPTSTQAVSAADPASQTSVGPGYSGAPVNPAPFTLTQPDGTTLRVHRFGDAASNGVATVKGGYTLVEGRDGYWRYAAGLSASGELRASSVVAGYGTAPKAAQGLAPAPAARVTPPRAPKAGAGADNELVILVSFEDQEPVGSTEDDWAKKYFGEQDSVAAFYDQASGGQYTLAPAAENFGDAGNGVVGWLELPYNHPNTGLTGFDGYPDDYVTDAIEAADDYVDYASFDANHDGELTTDELHVTVIGAGYETSYSGPNPASVCGSSIWAHQWRLAEASSTGAPTVDGVAVGDSGYTTFGEWHCRKPDDDPGHPGTIGVMAHEFGHDIGWPDLYDVSQSSAGMGMWSVMASGSWASAAGQAAGASPSLPGAWEKWYQGWITPTEVTSKTDDVSVPVGGAVLVSPNPGGVDWEFYKHSGVGEYFLVENRQLKGYDASLPGCGLVVYRIDETVTESNDANRDELDPLVKVIEADGTESLVHYQTNGTAGDPFPGSSGNHDLTDDTTPDARFYNGEPSGLQLHVDSDACADTMQIDVTPGRVSSPPRPPANDDFADAVTISGASGSLSLGSTKYATTEPGEPSPSYGSASVWYRWTAPATGDITLSTAGSRYDTVLGVYAGTAVDALTRVASSDNEDPANEVYTSKAVAHVRAGVTYSIAVAGWEGWTGPLKLAWSFAADPVTPSPPTATVTATPSPTPTPTPTPIVALPPANDRFAAATRLTGNRGESSGTTAGAGVETGERVFHGAGSRSVWFTWKAPRSGTVTFKADGSFAPMLAVVSGTKLANLRVLDTDTTAPMGKVRAKVVKGKTYRIVLDGRAGATGAYSLSWNLR